MSASGSFPGPVGSVRRPRSEFDPVRPDPGRTERRAILEALDEAGGNKSEAARRLGITRKTMHAKLAKYAMTASDA